MQKRSNKNIFYFISSLFILIISSCTTSGIQQRQVSTWNKLKWKNIHRQQLDYSCGAGALSTLIEYYFDDPAPEPLLLGDMLERLDKKLQDDRKERGFSIQDLKVKAERMGYLAAGVQLSPEMLLSLKGPVIVLLEGEKNQSSCCLKRH